MGAAIPHAAMLATSLVRILPYPKDEVMTSIKTGTVNVLDEVIPIYEDDEPETRGRSKSSVEIVICIGKRSDPTVVGEASAD
jgi:ribonuclease P/MRP protein subunit RPP20